MIITNNAGHKVHGIASASLVLVNSSRKSARNVEGIKLDYTFGLSAVCVKWIHKFCIILVNILQISRHRKLG